MRRLLHDQTPAKGTHVSSRPRERKPRRPLPLYGGFDGGRVKVCAGDCGIFFERKHAAEVRRILRPTTMPPINQKRRLSCPS